MSDDPTRAHAPEGGANDTRWRLSRARNGAHDSIAWLVERFDPYLFTAASYRLGDALKRVCDPRDLADEVWAVVLRRLPELERMETTEAFLAFLAQTMRHLLNNLVRRHLGAGRATATGGADQAQVERLAADMTSVTRAVRNQAAIGALRAALDQLDANDRAVVTLRGIEQVRAQDVALMLGVTESVVHVRFHRARHKLRKILGESLLDEIAGD